MFSNKYPSILLTIGNIIYPFNIKGFSYSKLTFDNYYVRIEIKIRLTMLYVNVK